MSSPKYITSSKIIRLQQIWDGHGVLEQMNCLIPWRDHSQHSRTEFQKIPPLCHNQIRLVFLDINTKQLLYIQRTKSKGFLFGNSSPSFNGSLVYVRLVLAFKRLNLGGKTYPGNIKRKVSRGPNPFTTNTYNNFVRDKLDD